MVLICEEYARRHKISRSYVRYIRKGSFYFRSTQRIWTFAIGRFQGNHQPPCFSVKHHDFGHNNCGSISTPTPPHILSLVEFDEFVMEMSKRSSRRGLLRSKKEVFLAAWEIFLVYCDHFIAEKLDPTMLFETIDSGSTLSARYESLMSVVRHLEYCHEDLFHIWNKVACHARNYLYWMNDLILEYGHKDKICN
jgi:hypothetical protein